MGHTCFHPAFDPTELRFVVGVDGGGSGTRARVWTCGGSLVGHGESGPSALPQGVGQAWVHIGEAVQRGFADAGVSAPAPRRCVIGLGLAGAVTPRLAAAFFRAAPDFALMVLETDARIALLGAHEGRPGAVVVVGTGAVGEALHADGRRVCVSGWGFPVGDEGSGAWLGLRAMQVAQRALDGRAVDGRAVDGHALDGRAVDGHALDGRAVAGALARAVWARAGARRDALLEWCSRASQREYAQLAPLVFDCACADEAAQALLDAAAREVEAMARALDPAGALPTALLGSVGTRLAARLAGPLRARLVEPAGDAVDGAHRLARLHMKETVA